VSENPRGFASDNASGVHPEVMAAIEAANDGHVTAYGADPYTERAIAAFRQHFGGDAQPFPVFNGTAANVLCVQALCRPHHAVICPETAHLNVDECGAPERIAGVKLLPVATLDGKVTPELVEGRIRHVGDEHAVQPRAVSISESTELGTVYTPDEIRAIADLAHSQDMLLHVDGARLANAAVAQGLPLRALTTDAGVDALSFGGTKNGLLAGDAVVLLRPYLADGFKYVRKQSLQLASKMRFISAQFCALLEGDLWRRNAEHANAMARRLGEALEGIDGVTLAQPVQANGVFANLPREAIEEFLDGADPLHTPFYVWDEATGTVRLMCTWDTDAADVDAFADRLNGV
jgi:threonine aldolase